MSFLTALGGVGQGVSQGIQDLNTQKQQQFLQEQQARVKKDWEEEDALKKELGLVQPNKSTRVMDANGDWQEAPEVTPLPKHEVLSKQAEVYLNSPNMQHKMFGMQLADKASQLENVFKLNKANTAREEMINFLNERGPEAFANRYGNLFQQNKLGPDELTSATVNSPNGQKHHVVIDRATGQEVSRLPITRAAAIDAIDALHGHALSSLSPELYFQNQNLGINKGNLAVQQGTLAVHQKDLDLKDKELAEKIKHNLFGAQTNQLNASANASNAAALSSRSHAGYFDAMVESVKGNKEAQGVAREYSEKFAALSPEDQNGPKGQALIAEGIAATAKKSGDLIGLMNSLKKPTRPVNEKEQEAAFKDLAAASNQKEIDFVHAKWPNVFGPEPLVEEFKKAQQANAGVKTAAKAPPAVPVPAPVPVTKGLNPLTAPRNAPTPAPAAKGLSAPIPNQPNPKLIREPNSRGGYTYTPSPRGMTRAEWDKLDKSKQR
jgi:hypothetical protein